MRITTKKGERLGIGDHSQKTKIIDLLPVLGLFIAFMVFISVIQYDFSNAKISDLSFYNNEKSIVGVDYKIGGEYCNQFRGEIKEVNNSAFIVSWYLYGSEDLIKRDFFRYEGANNYKLTIDLAFSDNGTTIGVFTVHWYKFNKHLAEQSVKYQIKPRDQNLNLVSFIQIQEVRKYVFERGVFN